MMVKVMLTISLLFTITVHAEAQKVTPYNIINALSAQLKTTYPVADSLYPVRTIDFELKGWEYLGAAEKNELRKSLRTTKGFKLNPDSLKNYKLIPSKPIFQAFLHPDSLNLRSITREPFYLVSNPVFFNNHTKAAIFLSLVRGFAYCVILERKNNVWSVVKYIYGWM